MHISDKIMIFGITNAKTIGLLLFSSCYLFAILRLLKTKEKLQGLLEGLIIINAGFFLFQTQSHDRYAFPLSVFLLLWAPFILNSGNPKDSRNLKNFIIFYVLFTIFYFYNLHTSLVVNYTNNGMPVLSLFTQPALTITTSVVLLGLFFLFMIQMAKTSHMITWTLPLCLLCAGLISANAPILFKKPVSLTKLTPIISQQGYGQRQTDMPVNAFLGYPKWSFLSVQYAFYKQGIGTHANSWIEYDINGKFKKFTSDYGIDTQAGAKGTAVFQVYGDGKLLFGSKTIGRYDMPRHIDVDITGVKRLGLITSDGGDGITDDHTDWLRPTLWP